MTLLPLHIAGGLVALVAGYIALYAAKGAWWHRKSGMLFVYGMFALSLSGAVMAALKTSGISVNVIAGLLTFYFVATGLLTVRPRPEATRWMDGAVVALALGLGVLAFKTGLDASKTRAPEAAPMFVFGIVAMLAASGDARMLRAGALQGRRRIARHLWRMCFAMWVAAASFFWGPRGRVPEIIYIPALLPIPVLTPIAVMLYWLWRLRRKGIAIVETRERYNTALNINPKEQPS